MPVTPTIDLGILSWGNTVKGPVDLTITLRCSDAEDVRGSERFLLSAVCAASARVCEKAGAKVILASAGWNQAQALMSPATLPKK